VCNGVPPLNPQTNNTIFSFLIEQTHDSRQQEKVCAIPKKILEVWRNFFTYGKGIDKRCCLLQSCCQSRKRKKSLTSTRESRGNGLPNLHL